LLYWHKQGLTMNRYVLMTSILTPIFSVFLTVVEISIFKIQGDLWVMVILNCIVATFISLLASKAYFINRDSQIQLGS